MSKSTKLLVIAAVAVMLVAATSAYGYYEHWDGWFNSGYFEYFNSPFYYTEGSGNLEDLTDEDDDTFFVSAVCVSTFSCAESGPYEGWTVKLWPGASGSKPTGQEGQKEVYDGAWAGYARLYDDENNLRETFDVGGTWNTRAPGDYFDYTDCPCPPGGPPTYSAHWLVTDSDPKDLTGAGGSAGDRIYYED